MTASRTSSASSAPSCASSRCGSRIWSVSPPRFSRWTSTPAGSRFLSACRLQPVDATPVWFMRQAGRYMSEYRALRERYSLLDLFRTPDLATEVTLQPVRRIELDAAILFSDLLLPLEPMGIGFDFVRGEGPAIERPLRSEDDLARVHGFEPREALGYVLDAIRQTQREL